MRMPVDGNPEEHKDGREMALAVRQ
jgi:hypothetical protein